MAPKSSKKVVPAPKIDWSDYLADYKDKVVGIAKSTGGAISSGFKMADKFSKEVTGAAAVTRALSNPSKSNVGKAALDVALFAAPIVKQGKMVGQAVRAGENAARTVIANRAGAQAAAAQGVNYTKSMMLKGGTGLLHSAADISQIVGRKVTTTGPKSLAAVTAATQRMVNTAGGSAMRSSLGQSAAKISGMAVAPIASAIKNMMGSTPSPVSKPVSKPAARKSADSYGSPKPQFRRSADANISPALKGKVSANGNRSSSYANYMDAKEYKSKKKK